jgi:hypothetical protein
MDIFSIQTRQKADTLFPAPVPPEPIVPGDGGEPLPLSGERPRILSPLPALSSVTQGPVEVDGYAVISVLAISDHPFSIILSEGILPGGPFTQTQVLVSVASGSLFVVTSRFSPVAMFLTMEVENTSPNDQKILSLVVKGIPLP